MKARLVIPRPPVENDGRIVESSARYHFPLRWTQHHPASRYGIGVLLSPNNEVFDGFMFTHLHDTVGAWIECDDPERVAAALGLPATTKGIYRGKR